MTNTIFSIIPPIIALVLVVLTRRVLLSLGLGSLAAVLIIANFQLGTAASTLFTAIKDVFISEGSINTGNVFIILFLIILGIITAFISITGGSRAFGNWAMKRVKTRVGAQLVGVILGMLIFIDDYFNALAVGQITRPITDRQKVSRAKLAYIIDSTSAPVCVVSPISSWGAYIISLIGTIFATNQIMDYSAFSAFMAMIPLNLYVWATVIIILFVVLRDFSVGPMKVHEDRAIATGKVFDSSKKIPGELKEDMPTSNKGTIGDLVWPIVALMVGTVASMLWTGYQAVEGNVTILTIFENTDVASSLFYGGIIGLVVSLFSFLRQSYVVKGVEVKVLPFGIKEGTRSMLPAVYILIFAWIFSDLIGQLETGAYLAGLINEINISASYIPFILFILTGIMAFATGTSWGSFGILLPIAAEIAVATDISFLLPAMAAVLAGAVFGDHCSPISDTTILSSTGAGCNLMDHVLTQLPYALISAGVAAAGYFILGLTGTSWAILPLFVVLIVVLFFMTRRKESVVAQ